jgi:hypothetical protein
MLRGGCHGILRQKTREPFYVLGLRDVWATKRKHSIFDLVCTNCYALADCDILIKVLMNLSSAETGTSFSNASASQVIHMSVLENKSGEGWDSTHGW